MIEFPRITIVMPSFNQAQYLEEAIQSVLDQGYPNLEFMILDGGSSDGSLDIIKKYKSKIDYWYCRPDNGQSAAINFGLSKSTGMLAGWLNSDDILLKGSLHYIAKAYQENKNAALFAGNLILINNLGCISGFLRLPANAAWFARHGIFAVSQPGSFFSKQIYHLVGGIREDYHYVMDNDLYLRIMISGHQFIYIDKYLAAFRRHDKQKNTAMFKAVKEEGKILGNNLKKSGIQYRSIKNLVFFHAWQIINGNYFKMKSDKQLHMKKRLNTFHINAF